MAGHAEIPQVVAEWDEDVPDELNCKDLGQKDGLQPLEISLECKVVSFISSLAPMGPHTLRAARAGAVLGGRGSVLRSKWKAEPLYELSGVAESIDEFWCHSWHGSTTWKICCLIFKNGTPAFVVASLVAIMLASLSFLDFLPGWDKEPSYPTDGFTGQHLGNITGGGGPECVRCTVFRRFRA